MDDRLEVLTAMARALSQAGRHDDAIELLVGLTVDRDEPSQLFRVRRSLGVAYSHAGRHQEALDELERLLEEDMHPLARWEIQREIAEAAARADAG